MEIRMQRVLLRSSVAMTASLCLAAVTAGPSVAAPTGSVELSPLDARLIARGAGVRVGAVYSCSKTTTSTFLYVRVTERVTADHVAQGSASSDTLKCDGLKHTVKLAVVSENGYAFRQGVALANGTLTACDAVPACTSAAFLGTTFVDG